MSKIWILWYAIVVKIWFILSSLNLHSAKVDIINGVMRKPDSICSNYAPHHTQIWTVDTYG